MFEIYKKGQGKYTRGVTFAATLALAVIGAYWLSERLQPIGNIYVQFGVPVVVLAGLAWLLFWVVNRPSTADFMIATEGEMKKVSWTSRREIIGSTKVVIFTTFAMAIMLFAVDAMFQLFFHWTGVMRIIAG